MRQVRNQFLKYSILIHDLDLVISSLFDHLHCIFLHHIKSNHYLSHLVWFYKNLPLHPQTANDLFPLIFEFIS